MKANNHRGLSQAPVSQDTFCGSSSQSAYRGRRACAHSVMKGVPTMSDLLIACSQHFCILLDFSYFQQMFKIFSDLFKVKLISHCKQ